MRKWTWHRALAGAAVVALMASSASVVRAGSSSPISDFDGDGRPDLAVGVPHADINGKSNAGAVAIVYNGHAGLGANRTDFWHQGRLPRIDGAKAEPGDRFGSALAAADFNGDGFTDLAIGAPGEDHDGLPDEADTQQSDAGAVHVLYGSTDGLTAAGALTILDDRRLPGTRFGAALAAGHLYGGSGTSTSPDPFVDLVVGAPGSPTQRGAVWRTKMAADGIGGASGLHTCPDGGPGDACGASLAVGRLSGSAFFAIVAGAPGATVDGLTGAGLVSVRLPLADGTGRHQSAVSYTADDVPFIAPQAAARFGHAVLVADVSGTAVGDLLIGVPGQDVNVGESLVSGAGSVVAVIGGADGLTNVVGIFRESTDDISDQAEAGDGFGSALAVGSFDGSTTIAIGVPGEDLGTKTDAGAVNLYFTSTADRRVTIDSSGIAGTAKAGDRFGATLFRMQLVGSAHEELVIGAPRADVGAATDAGAVHVLPGSATGPSGDGDTRWTLDSPGVQGTAAKGDRFGSAID